MKPGVSNYIDCNFWLNLELSPDFVLSWNILAIVSDLQVTESLSHGNTDTFYTWHARAPQFVAANLVSCNVVLDFAIPKTQIETFYFYFYSQQWVLILYFKAEGLNINFAMLWIRGGRVESCKAHLQNIMTIKGSFIEEQGVLWLLLW